eukprot:CAMPEP_0184479796 /NCGR_PEP_ID=MMETSP0113_2-20130426/1378_1 /TAXON_ID=91329 /ORGANISM="Norrisiella sphaerica, Strain BC52" /LENGTH=183 /DNA_ID=CAMNT_0026857947 /DNA_START=209 /DNA_END=761 /DNA_ORIENTATION=+
MIGVSACHAMIGILNLISGNAWDGIFDLLAAGIGYYGCREPARIQPTMILCYVVFVIMDCFWASLAAMLLLAGVKEVNGPRWRKGLFIGVTYTSVIFYAVAIYVSYKLYTLLKRQYDSLSGLEAGGVPFTDASAERSGAGGGGGGGFPAPGVVSRRLTLEQVEADQVPWHSRARVIAWGTGSA